MPDAIETPVSPISDPAHGKSPRDALTGFLKYTVDSPDLDRAKTFISKRSAAAGRLHAVPPGASYTLGPEETDELGTRIAVTVRAGAFDEASTESSAQEEFTVPVIVVEEEGEWKIDLPATMERMLGGAAATVGEALAATTQALSAALTGAQAALTDTLGPAPSPRPSPAAPKTKLAQPAKKKAKPAKKTAPKKPAAKKPATKKPPKRPAKQKSKPKAKPQPRAKPKAKMKPAAKKSTPKRTPAKKRRR